jgi:hypothetical protein
MTRYWDGGYYSFHVNQLNASEAGGSENFFLHVTVSRWLLRHSILHGLYIS